MLVYQRVFGIIGPKLGKWKIDGICWESGSLAGILGITTLQENPRLM
jgi:hypothetical protein